MLGLHDSTEVFEDMSDVLRDIKNMIMICISFYEHHSSLCMSQLHDKVHGMFP
jgi:hypothetical protein